MFLDRGVSGRLLIASIGVLGIGMAPLSAGAQDANRAAPPEAHIYKTIDGVELTAHVYSPLTRPPAAGRPAAVLVALPTQQNDSSAPKSERTALRWSLASTVLPVAMGGALTAIYLLAGESQGGEMIGLYPAVAGVLGGPAVGHFYAGRPLRALGGIGIRSGILAAAFVAAIAECIEDCTAAEERNAAVLFSLGAGLAAASAIVDIAAAPASARHYNQRLRRVAITPWAAPSPGRFGVIVLINH
jgi:hypothetical protein